MTWGPLPAYPVLPSSPYAVRTHPVELVLYVPVPADPGGQGSRPGGAVAGNQVDDLDGLLAFLRDGAAQLRDLGGAGEPDPGRRQRDLDRAAGAAAMALAHRGRGGDAGPGQLLELPVQRRHVALDRHHVVRVPAQDDLRSITLRMECVDRDHCAGQAREGLQQVPDGRDLVRLRVHGGLPEDRADAVCQGRDQVRDLPVLVLRAADGLAVDRDYQAAPTCTALVQSQAPRT